MGGRASKRKGSAFEREVCEKLSLWITGGRQKDCLWRSAMSGGRATRQGLGVRQAGDITAVAPEGHSLTDRFVIECKARKDLMLGRYMLVGTGKMSEYWETVEDIGLQTGKHALLIAKSPLLPTVVVLRPTGYEALTTTRPTDLPFVFYNEELGIMGVRLDDLVSEAEYRSGTGRKAK